jgi:hypothetical protein
MEEIKKPEVKIEVDDLTAQGVYCNLAMIGHSEDEFVFDFIFLQPQTQKAKVRSRIITSPGHAKRLLAALKDNITKYEAHFGEIKVATPQPDLAEKPGYFH